MLEQGPVERNIIEQATRQHMPIPRRIQNAPALLMGLDIYLLAFIDLNTTRPAGLATGPIPWNAVQEYCGVNGLDSEQTEDMHYHIRKMDKTWQEYHASKDGGNG